MGRDVSKGRFVVITGLSGAGKTQALRVLEDMGYFCVDNLPPALIPPFAKLCDESEGRVSRIALVVDIRGGEFFLDLSQALDGLDEMGFIHQILFLEADPDVLVRRHKETRRRHPLLPEVTIEEAIRHEKDRLQDIRGRANKIIDTSGLTSAQLREKLVQMFSNDRDLKRFMITLVSFGFKHGLPAHCDLVFDVRFLPNPQYVDGLKAHDGREGAVFDYVIRRPLTQALLRRLTGLLEFLVPHYINEGRAQLVIGIGCTGGRHRSVAVAERLAVILRGRKHTVLTEHRDVDKGAG